MPDISSVHVDTALSGLTVATKPGPDGRPKFQVKDCREHARTVTSAKRKKSGITKKSAK